MTDNILKLLEQRRLTKTNKTEYRHLQRRIKKEFKLAKEKWIRERCDEMEDVISKHDLFNVHKKLKEMSNIFKKKDYIEGLQILLDRIHEVGEEISIKINSNITKFLVFSRDPHPDAKLQLNGVQVEKVHKMTYLGTVITDQLDPNIEIVFYK
ncbi:unnamed protein product [Diabrotica balteata]|uniref:Uncharacterized protein n=1 Tax=Diabrotica balteata TaxID=107213 RepID=A0A9N9T340_DIABA|nr:unnamed protein product [Diabrotica balteata]